MTTHRQEPPNFLCACPVTLMTIPQRRRQAALVTRGVPRRPACTAVRRPWRQGAGSQGRPARHQPPESDPDLHGAMDGQRKSNSTRNLQNPRSTGRKSAEARGTWQATRRGRKADQLADSWVRMTHGRPAPSPRPQPDAINNINPSTPNEIHQPYIASYLMASQPQSPFGNANLPQKPPRPPF
jgi:hypothetical protein